MPYRITHLVSDQIYHVFNRGVARLPIFSSTKDYKRFLELVDYYRFTDIPCSYSQFKKIASENREKILNELRANNNIHIEILAFCLMPNHFHFLIRQISDNGLKIFMSNFQNGYVKYYNLKSERGGPLFQSSFKAVRIESDEQLLHVSRYIHLNPCTSFLIGKDNLTAYQWSSYSDYILNNSDQYIFVKKELVLAFFKNLEDYKQFTMDQADYQRELDRIKHLTFE